MLSAILNKSIASYDYSALNRLIQQGDAVNPYNDHSVLVYDTTSRS
jgi:hypothetical protein